jgi:gluconolactonase
VLVTQMGGLDFSLLAAMMPMPVVNPVRWEPACVQRVSPAGVVTPLCGLGLVNTPNDLVVDHANNVWFTDPDYNPSRGPVIARVFRYRAHDVAASGRPTLDAAGRLEVWDEYVDYVNGIALAPDGTIIVAEQDGLRRLDPTTGAREWIVKGIAHIDGFTVDAAGRMYCCSPGNGVNIYEPDGTHVERMALPDGAYNLNCCFGGPDLRTLFITDVSRAGVLAVEGLPTPGCEVFAYRD